MKEGFNGLIEDEDDLGEIFFTMPKEELIARIESFSRQEL